MAENENSSFIPRQSPVTSGRRRRRQSVGLFGYASYIIFIGSLLASVGIFFYAQYIQTQLADKQSELEVVKNQFDQSEMNRVQEFESFLSTVSKLYQSSIILERLFTTVEDSIAEGAVFSSMEIVRGPEKLAIEAEVSADSFDTALFQRSVYEEYPLLSSFSLENVALADSVSTDGEGSGTELSTEAANLLAQAGSDSVTFLLTFDIASSELSFANIEIMSDEEEADEDDSTLFEEEEVTEVDLDSEETETSTAEETEETEETIEFGEDEAVEESI